MKTRKHGPGILIGLIAMAVLCSGIGDARGQSPFYLRVGAEAGRVTVEHTKKVTIGGGSSSSTSTSTGAALGGGVAFGARLVLPGNWLAGGELEAVVSSRRMLEGTISPTRSGYAHDVWPGRWDYSDRVGAGGNIILGRRVAAGLADIYVLGGIRRAWTEFATGGTNPETGVAGEDRERLARWPWSFGAGTTLRLKWPVDFRVRYIRSITDWVVADESVRLDYRYSTNGVLVSIGIHVFG